MDTNEIINRSDTEVFSIEEMCRVIEHYVEVKKQQTIVCNPFRGLNRKDPFFPMMYAAKTEMLANAFTIAKVWLKENHSQR